MLSRNLKVFKYDNKKTELLKLVPKYTALGLVDIGMIIAEEYPDWKFGLNVYQSIEDCNRRYLEKNYGKLDYNLLSEGQKKIVVALKDYGMERAVEGLTIVILNEIESELNVRCSAYDILQAFNRLAEKSQNRGYYQRMIKCYL